MTVKNELYHHGILGMRWGIRRYQNKDGTLTQAGRARLDNVNRNPSESIDDLQFKKGEKFNRIGASDEIDEGRTYVSKTNSDRLKYLEMSLGWDLPDMNELELKSLDKINVAGSKAQLDAFIAVVGEFSIDKIVQNEKIYNKRGKITKDSKKEINKIIEDFNDMLDSGNPEKAKKYFESRLSYNDEVSFAYFDKLKEKGYQACVDFNDKKVAELPLIVFDREKYLKTISVKPIQRND